MTKKWILVILVLASILIGWVGGYFRVLGILSEPDFISGFLLCLSIGALIYSLRKLGVSRELKARAELVEKNSYIYLALTIVLLFFAVVSIVWVNQQNQLLKDKIDSQEGILLELKDGLTSVTTQSVVAQIPLILRVIQQELESDSLKRISINTIDRLAAVSELLKPRRTFYLDSDSSKMSSPERGQLLLQLIHLKMDSNSFMDLKRKVTFEAADLENADLGEIDMSCANLNKAILSNCNLKKSNFHHANLEGADIRKSELVEACFNAANLTRADLSWSNATSASFVGATMDGARLDNIQAIGCDLSYSSIQWAELKMARLGMANCHSTDFKGSNLGRINLDGAVLVNANLIRANIKQASLLTVQLDGARVKGLDWISMGIKENVSGISQVNSKYGLVSDANSPNKFVFRLKSEI